MPSLFSFFSSKSEVKIEDSSDSDLTQTTQSQTPPNHDLALEPDENQKLRLLRGLDSGDVVLFNRKCMAMAPYGAFVCALAKAFSNSRWDHVGVVVKHPDTGVLYFLEADFGGVKLRPLKDRIMKSKSKEIAVRRLSILRTPKMRMDLFQFSQEMVGRPYETETGQFLASVFNPLPNQERERLHAIMIEKRTNMQQIERELTESALTAFQRRALLKEYHRLQGNIAAIQSRISEHFPEKQGPQVYKNDDKLEKVFCSELTAAALQSIGLLESYPPAGSYNPKDFSSEQINPPGIHLLKGATFSPEHFFRIRGDQKETSSFDGVEDGSIPNEDSRRFIKRTLKKTPVFNEVVGEFKRSNLIQNFRAVIVEPGDFVFRQGEMSNDFYIVEKGQLERFIKRDENDAILVGTINPGASFGTHAFMSLSPRAATVRARERSLVWKLNRAAFDKFHEAADVNFILGWADKMQLRNYLKNHFIFRRLDRIGAEELGAFFKIKFRAGETVFKQGDRGDNFYIIKSGEAERHIRPSHQQAGHEDEVFLSQTMGPGQSFGELALMFDGPRGGTVRARTDLECWAINAESFHHLHLGGGASYLMSLFNKFASVEIDGKKYMTGEDFLKFAKADTFDPKDRDRISSLLLTLVSSNRKPGLTFANSIDNRKALAEMKKLLIDFWEFVRFDISLNQPCVEMELAFKLSDSQNTGFVDFEEYRLLLDAYSKIDDDAARMANNISRNPHFRRAFGSDGSQALMYKEFVSLSKDILPKKLLEDIQLISKHLLNEMEPPNLDIAANYFESETEQPKVKKPNVFLGSSGQGLGGIDLGHLLAIGFSGIVSRTFVAPLERVKILMQTDIGVTKQYPKMFRSFKTVVKREGLRGLFRGNGANVLRVAPAAAVQVTCVEMMRSYVASKDSSSILGMHLGTFEAVGIGGAAGIVASIAFYPLDYAHGRLSFISDPVRQYGIVQVLHESIKHNGPLSIYRGLVPTLLGVFPYVGLSFGVYETLRPILPKQNNGTGQPTLWSSIFGGLVASSIGQLCSFPLDTCRRVMQVDDMYPSNQALNKRGMLEVMRDIVKIDGIYGLFRGAMPNLLKVAPASIVNYLVYERIRTTIEDVKRLSVTKEAA